MSSHYQAALVCDFREWDGTPCDEVMDCAEGIHPPGLGDMRRVARVSGWHWRYGPRGHIYDLCPEHGGQLPRRDFPDWRNAYADVAADRAAAAVRGAAAFGAEMKAQGIHVGVGSPPICVVCEIAWPCNAAQPDGLGCLADDDAIGR